jgi:hypothetical protein
MRFPYTMQLNGEAFLVLPPLMEIATLYTSQFAQVKHFVQTKSISIKWQIHVNFFLNAYNQLSLYFYVTLRREKFSAMPKNDEI